MSNVLAPRRQTRGERLVAQLLSQLSSETFYPVAEPMISTRSGGKRPDFVVVARYLGVAVIEVKDWKEIVQATQRHFTVRRTDGVVEAYPNPANTARDYAIELADKFKEHEGLLGMYDGRSGLLFPWQEVVVLTNVSQEVIDQLEEHSIVPSRTLIGRETLESAEALEDALVKLPWRFRLKSPLGQAVLDMVRSVIEPDIIIRNPQGQTVGVETLQQERLIRELPVPDPSGDEQVDDDLLPDEARQIIRDLSVRLVRGVAGSGKTLVLVRRAQFLQQHFPHYRVLALTFNVDLAADLQRRMSSESIMVTTFHKLCARILGDDWRSPIEIGGWLKAYADDLINQSGMTIDFVAEEIKWRKETQLFSNDDYLETPRMGRGTRLGRKQREVINQVYDLYADFQTARNMNGRRFYDWEDVPHLAFEALSIYGHPLRQAFDVVLLDEAQDFAPSWIKVVKLLTKSSGSIMVCDDPTQSLFKYYSWKEKGFSVVGRTSVLRVPFRCTREIMRAAFGLVEADPVLSASEDLTKPRLNIGELRSGPLPRLVACSDWDAEQRFVRVSVEQKLAEGVLAGQIAVLCHDSRHARAFADLKARGVYIASFEKMKGLEFTAVFLPHLNTSFATSGEHYDEFFVSKRRRRIYVGMTRARSDLVLSYHGRLTEELQPLKSFTAAQLPSGVGS